MKEPRMTQTKMQPLEILSSLGINGLHTVIPVHGGFDMAMWKVEYEGQTYALRVFPPERQEDCERDHGMCGGWGLNLAACRRRSMQCQLLICSVNSQRHGLPGNAKGNRQCKIACVTCLLKRWLCCISTITRVTC